MDKQSDPQSADLSQTENQSKPVKETYTSAGIAIDDKFEKILVLNQELHSANNQLYEQVEYLKDQLAESEKALQWQKRRSTVAESIVNQQNQELSAAQEQIRSLFQELEKSIGTVKNQEDIINNLREQLQISQERLAKLERECTLLQTNYNEKYQQALQSENTCRELRSRLLRQQRQTLQFKAALEKCLEKPNFNDTQDGDIRVNLSEEMADSSHRLLYGIAQENRFSRRARSFLSTEWENPNMDTIKPWVPESEHEEVRTDAHDSLFFEAPTNTPSQPSDAEIIPTEDSSSLDEIDSIIENFFPTSYPASTTKNRATYSYVEDVPKQLPKTDSTTASQDTPDYWQPIATPTKSPLNVNDSGNQPNNLEQLPEESTHNQSPSPIVYPGRQPKRRKSLSSVELPNFRPPRPSNDS